MDDSNSIINTLFTVQVCKKSDLIKFKSSGDFQELCINKIFIFLSQKMFGLREKLIFQVKLIIITFEDESFFVLRCCTADAVAQKL